MCIAHQTPTPKMGILEAVPLDYGGIVDCNNQGTPNYSMRYLLVPFENNLLFITYSCFSASPTYITNLIYAGVDPKTVQYLAGHENSKTTMDIYAKVKYNQPEDLLPVVNEAFGISSGQ